MRKHALMISVLSVVFTASALVTAQEPAPAAAPAPAPAPAAEAPAPAVKSEPAPAPAPAAETPAPAPAPAAEAPAPTPETKRGTFVMRGMLPLGYRDIVTGEQRDKIYGIQQEYRPKMEELQAQMRALRAEMNQKIEGVLTSEQLEKVKARENEIRTRRNVRRGK